MTRTPEDISSNLDEYREQLRQFMDIHSYSVALKSLSELESDTITCLTATQTILTELYKPTNKERRDCRSARQKRLLEATFETTRQLEQRLSQLSRTTTTDEFNMFSNDSASSPEKLWNVLSPRLEKAYMKLKTLRNSDLEEQWKRKEEEIEKKRREEAERKRREEEEEKKRREEERQRREEEEKKRREEEERKRREEERKRKEEEERKRREEEERKRREEEERKRREEEEKKRREEEEKKRREEEERKRREEEERKRREEEERKRREEEERKRREEEERKRREEEERQRREEEEKKKEEEEKKKEEEEAQFYLNKVHAIPCQTYTVCPVVFFFLHSTPTPSLFLLLSCHYHLYCLSLHYSHFYSAL